MVDLLILVLCAIIYLPILYLSAYSSDVLLLPETPSRGVTATEDSSIILVYTQHSCLFVLLSFLITSILVQFNFVFLTFG